MFSVKAVKINSAGLNIIKESEGLRLTGYLCPAKIPTNGYGHTGPDVFVGQKITLEEADALLANDLARFERGVTNLLDNALTNHNQFSALVSLAYNIGLGAFAKSTALREHKAGNYSRASAGFMLWIKAKGKILGGLVTRRRKEVALYVS